MRRRFKAGPGGAASSSDPAAAHAAAIRLLARRDYAAGELAGRLREDGYSAEVVTPLVDELTEGRMLDDARFATHYVAYHAERGQGPRRIAQELSGRGVASHHVEAALAAIADWGALARQVRARRFGATPPDAWAEKARQGRFLQYRGFSSDHIRTALGPDFESEDPS